jgi:glycosidase
MALRLASLSRLGVALGFLVSATLALAGGCTEVNHYVGEVPPPGNYQGAGGAPGYGYGASNGDGGGGEPIECDDAYKRCPVTFSLAFNGEESVELRGDFAPDGWEVGVPMELDGASWNVEIDVAWDAPVQYKFVIDGTTWITDPQNPNTIDDGFGGLNSLFEGTTCPDDFTCAPPILGYDWRDAVLYFVFVDRFFDGNAANNGSPVGGVPTASNFQGGDWAGVRQKLEEGYFEDLGVNTLWLSVPMANTNDSGLGDDGQLYSAYHGYWPTDLEATQSRFGSLSELTELVEACHDRDIKVIVDYAMNHVHVDSPTYQQNPGWFWPLDFSGKHCVCGSSDCSFDGPDGKRCWFRDYLPDFNFNVAAARDFSVSNAVSWILDTGIDGFRLDAVKHIEDSWVTELRERVTSDVEPVTEQHFYMVGETFTGDKGLIGYYVDPGTMLDGQFDFPLRAAIVSAMLTRTSSMSSLEDFLAANDGYYGAGVMSTFVGNHDVPRPIHFAQDTPLWGDEWANGKDRAWTNQPGLPGESSAFERLANSFTLLFTLPGIPLIYYGDEYGMPGAGDPDNRRFMQWAGHAPRQLALREHIKALAAIRAAHPALRRGTRTPLSDATHTLAFRMTDGGDDVIVVINRGDTSANVPSIPSGNYQDALDGSRHSGPSVSVPARSARILIGS